MDSTVGCHRLLLVLPFGDLISDGADKDKVDEDETVIVTVGD